MGLKISTGLANSLNGDAFLQGTSLAYVDNGAGEDQITDSESRFLDAGFRVGDSITTTGSTTGGNDVGPIVLTGVAAGTINFITGTLAATEAFVAATTLTSNNGDALKELLKDGVIEIRTGSQPADADAAETGTLLCTISVDGGTFTPGSPTNGLEFKKIIDGYLYKNDDETWQGTAVATGIAGWFRYYDNNKDTGADKTARRFDGNCGTSGSTMVLASTNIVSGAPIILSGFSLRHPLYA